MSDPEDVSHLDGNALVDRVAALKVESERLRLALKESQIAYAEAVEQGAALTLHRDQCVADNARLRGLMRAMGPVAFGKCPWCGILEIHAPECPWSAIRSEASKP